MSARSGVRRRQVEVERRRLPETLRLIALTERKVAMLRAVLAGKQSDDTLPLPVRREVRDPRASEASAEAVSVAEEDQDHLAPEEGESPPGDRIAEVIRKLFHWISRPAWGDRLCAGR